MKECIKILKAAKVKVGNKFPGTLDIQGAHRKRNKGKVIVKFVNRKFADVAIANRSNLKDLADCKDIYINSSLCPEFSFIDFAVRKAKKNEEIFFYKMKNGVSLFQEYANGMFVEVSHVNDLLNHAITVPTRKF